MSRWPKDNQTTLIKFYGDPGTGEVARQLVKLAPPFKLYFRERGGQKLVPYMLVHEKCRDAFAAALQKIWDYYGRDQSVIDKLHVSWTSGTYAPRKVRGSKTKWSNHAYGAAWDVDAEDNPLGQVKNKLPLPVVAAFKSEGASWGGDYRSRKDNMHLEFCDRGEPSRTFAQWLDYYECPPSYFPGRTEVVSAKPASVPSFLKKSTDDVRGDEVIWNTQRRLKGMSYNPGELDGIWGGMTAGAVTGFINDRQLSVRPPTSAEEFAAVGEELSKEISRAESEHWSRPIAPERAAATEAEVATKVQELAPVRQNKLASVLTGVGAILSGIGTAIMKYFKDAMEWIQPVREFFSDVPGEVWFFLIAGMALYIGWNARRSGNKIVEDYKSGDRL